MRKTKVKALFVGNGRNKIFKAGQTVSEQDFLKGEFDKKIADGFLHPVTEKDDGKKPNFDDEDQPTVIHNPPQTPGLPGPQLEAMPQLTADQNPPTDPPKVEGPKIEDTTVDQMKKDLKERGVEFPANAKKEDLFKLWARG